MNNIATGRDLSPGGELLPPHHGSQQWRWRWRWRRWRWLKGQFPVSAGSAEQRLMSPESPLQRRRRCGTLSRKMSIPLRFSPRSEFIGGGAMSEGTQGPHTTGWHGQGHPRHHMVWLPPGPPPSLLWTPSRVEENRNFGLRFVQF
jgi:hypothetical protein